MTKAVKKITSSQIIIAGFIAVILAGTGLLMLPGAVRGDDPASFADALFTSVSAVCVTGLVVQDTALYWSSFGQAVILALIQIGGLGVITVAAAISVVSGKKIGLKQRSIVQEAVSAPNVGGIIRLTGFIITITLALELLGALCMMPVFCRDLGAGKGIWYSFFHSISAFCNAGFDLMGFRQPFSSLTAYASRPLINSVVMFLITAGGIGFLTWDDIFTHGFRIHRYRVQSKIVLSVSAVLIVLPALYFFFFEFGGMALKERVWVSLFQAVTPRTAGFNTTDLSLLTESGLAVMILLMLTGGSPGSTAGGMKTTTLAVLVGSVRAAVLRRENAAFFGRRIPEQTVHSAVTLAAVYGTLFLSGGIFISRIEGLPLMTCLFESASAIGTVGLSLGITPGLSMVSRAILITLMFTGRVGGLTLIYSTVKGYRGATSRLPAEKIITG